MILIAKSLTQELKVHLIKQLVKLLDMLDLDEIGMQEKIKSEIEKYKRFQFSLLGEKPTEVKTTEIDIRNYAKYILRNGDTHEKQGVLSCLKSSVVVNNMNVRIT